MGKHQGAPDFNVPPIHFHSQWFWMHSWPPEMAVAHWTLHCGSWPPPLPTAVRWRDHAGELQRRLCSALATEIRRLERGHVSDGDKDGDGSTPILPYIYHDSSTLGGMNMHHQLFWCSPGLQGFDPELDGYCTSNLPPNPFEELLVFFEMARLVPSQRLFLETAKINV